MKSQPQQQDSAPQTGDEPLGDRGERGKTWSPPEGEQGISNRPDDADPEDADDDTDTEVDDSDIDEDADADESERGI